MPLVPGKPTYTKVITVVFTDTDSGLTYNVSIAPGQGFLHDYGQRVHAQIQEWEDSAFEANGKPTVEEWLDRLADRNP